MMPNFLIIGTSKAGTTALYLYLKQHPQIYMSSIKEPRFFAFEGEKLDFKGPADESLKQGIVTNIKDYCALFQGVSRERAVGEVSPVYLYSTKAPERIRHYIPDVKLIAVLRNPIERAYSNFLAKVRDGSEPLTDFAQVLQEEETRIRNNWSYTWHYRQRGFYYAQLRRYFNKFDREQIRVYLYEDWKASNIMILQEIFHFLNVDDTFVPDISVRPNVSGIPRSEILHRYLTKRNLIMSTLKPFLPRRLRQRILAKLRTAFVNLMSLNLVRPQLPLEVRRQLVQEYREDILRLQELIDRDLSKWLEP